MAKTATATKTGTQINVYIKEGLFDQIGVGIEKDIADLAITGVRSVKAIKVYTIHGNVSRADLARIGGDLLADAVTQNYTIGDLPAEITKGAWVAHVRFNPGVTDAVGQTTAKGIADLGITGVEEAHTSMVYVIAGKINKSHVDEICRRLLANSIIQSYSIEKK